MSTEQQNPATSVSDEWIVLASYVLAEMKQKGRPDDVGKLTTMLNLLWPCFLFANENIHALVRERKEAEASLAEATNAIHDLQQESAAYERGRQAAFAEVLAELENLRGVLLATEVEGLTGASVSARQANLIAHGYRTMAEIAKLAGLATAQEGIKMLPPDKLRRKCEMWEQGVAKMLPRFQRLMSTSQQSLDAWRDLTNLRDRVNEIK